MAIISCPECGKKVSDKAIACPDCGNPISQQHPHISAGHITIEHTSKKLKRNLLIYAILIGISFILMMIGLFIRATASEEFGAFLSSISFLLMIIGVFGLILTKIKIWWRHG
ncbi:MAG: zinc ribbon domain-containing protein [Bacteroidales bacterium]